MNADGSQNRFLVKGGAPRWSPDGKRLLYLAEGEPKGSQLFVRWVDAEGPATQITHVTEAPRNAKWSPDGKSIAFSMFVPATEKWSISMPAEPKGAKWTPAPRVVSTMHYRQDQVGYLEDGFTHLFVVPAEGGTRATADDREVERRRRRTARRRLDRLDAGQQVDRVRRQPIAGRRHAVRDVADLRRRRRQRRDPRARVERRAQWGKPVVSPDGRTVAFTGHAPTGRSHTVSDMFVIPITGGVGRHAQDQRRLRSRSDQPALGAGRHRRCTSTPTIAARATSSSRRSSAASNRSPAAGTC